MIQDENKLRLLKGGVHIDERGIVSFVNEFDFKGVDRFYSIRFHRANEPRGWVGHRLAKKWFTVIQGAILIAIVEPDQWDLPTRNLPLKRYVLSGDNPQVLCVPAGFVAGFLNFSADAILIVFSSGNLEDAMADEYRFKVDYWPIVSEKEY